MFRASIAKLLRGALNDPDKLLAEIDAEYRVWQEKRGDEATGLSAADKAAYWQVMEKR